ncbi:MAG TPA: hypothetical protein VGL38_04675 [bacterium]|jgi:hypothetical protein
MDSKLTQRPQGRQGGYVLVAVAALTTVLLATGIAFMRWSTDEALQSRESAAAMQAYYLAQMGIVEEGFMWLRSQKETELPTGEVTRPGRDVNPDGGYSDVSIFGMPSINQGQFWLEDRRFRISAIGKVRVPVLHEGANDFKEIKRKAILYVQVRNFADYMYLSDCELTTFGDRIKFWTPDTLQGRVHSNSLIAIEGTPQFYGQVSTTECDFWRGPGYNPGFHGPQPQFRAPRVEIPELANNLRQGASMQGQFYNVPGKQYRTTIASGTVYVDTWDVGTPFDSTFRQPVPIVGRLCMFFDGPLELKGSGLTGQVTIGCSNNIRLIDDITYAGAGPQGEIPVNSLAVLGIVSEHDVKVANTVANGRENSAGAGQGQNNRNLTSIIIDAAIVALGESFTFEQQNDVDSGYVYQTGNPPQPARDDRGTIYVYGSITQKRRGYVHRSTNGSTGYAKQYRYDWRFDRIKPPCFFHVTDDAGHALFNVVQWGEANESRNEVQRWNMVRYN